MAVNKRRDMPDMGLRVAKVREARGMTQQDLATDSDMSRSTLGPLERGEKDPRASTVISLCEALQCTPNDLFPERLSEYDTRNREIKALEDRLKTLTPYQFSRFMSMINNTLDVFLIMPAGK